MLGRARLSLNEPNRGQVSLDCTQDECAVLNVEQVPSGKRVEFAAVPSSSHVLRETVDRPVRYDLVAHTMEQDNRGKVWSDIVCGRQPASVSAVSKQPEEPIVLGHVDRC